MHLYLVFSLVIRFKFDVGYICEGKVLQYYKSSLE